MSLTEAPNTPAGKEADFQNEIFWKVCASVALAIYALSLLSRITLALERVAFDTDRIAKLLDERSRQG